MPHGVPNTESQNKFTLASKSDRLKGGVGVDLQLRPARGQHSRECRQGAMDHSRLRGIGEADCEMNSSALKVQTADESSNQLHRDSGDLSDSFAVTDDGSRLVDHSVNSVATGRFRSLRRRLRGPLVEFTPPEGDRYSEDS